MKNIYILPTDKPSRLVLDDTTQQLILINKGEALWGNRNIYITSDEEVKDGEYGFCMNLFNQGNEPYQIIFKMDSEQRQAMIELGGQKKAEVLKVILTTDQDLIKDGVQSIDDEFLEWFVKNSSCEWVEAKLIEEIPSGFTFGMFGNDEPPTELVYKIIIPKEELTISDEAKQRAKNYMSLKGALEPKQETLEEANWKVLGTKKDTFYNGAKWQAERMYSEEGVLKILRQFNKDKPKLIFGVEEWFEQFKKK